MNKKTIDAIKKMKNREKITVITCYDSLFAKIFDGYIDIILVGDSLNMSFLGKKDTISATLTQMIYHSQAVCNGAKNSFIVVDMPFGTYIDKETALKNAIQIFQETNADAIKIEGGAEKREIISHLVKNGIAVMGHIGLLPQSVRSEGGYKVKGKTEIEIEQLLIDAKSVEESGAFCVVLEGVKGDVSNLITKSVNIPTIGIGSGVECDGQVLVFSDMLGLFTEFKPKFVKQYMNGYELVQNSVNRYVEDVKNNNFPDKEHTY